jgi:hypothetical protein
VEMEEEVMGVRGGDGSGVCAFTSRYFFAI